MASQFSLRLTVITIFAGVALALLLFLVSDSRRDALYFTPYHLLGDALFPLAAVLFFASPVLLIAIGLQLCFRHPGPILVYVFLISISMAVVQAIAWRTYVSELCDFAQVMSPILVVISGASVAESAIRKLESHYITSWLTLPIGLGYWFMSSFIVSYA